MGIHERDITPREPAQESSETQLLQEILKMLRGIDKKLETLIATQHHHTDSPPLPPNHQQSHCKAERHKHTY